MWEELAIVNRKRGEKRHNARGKIVVRRWNAHTYLNTPYAHNLYWEIFFASCVADEVDLCFAPALLPHPISITLHVRFCACRHTVLHLWYTWPLSGNNHITLELSLGDNSMDPSSSQLLGLTWKKDKPTRVIGKLTNLMPTEESWLQ